MRGARGLYAIVDPAACRGRDPALVAGAILRGGCAVLQLRDKSSPDAARLGLARRLASAARAAGVPFVVNDRADLALLSGADGLHLGQGDLSVAEARRIVGAMPIGCSTHDASQARAAIEAGADLVAFGPIYATQSKERPDPVVGLEALARLCRDTAAPVVAIGGITLERASLVREAGAALGAAIAAICAAEDPTEAARALHCALGGAS